MTIERLSKSQPQWKKDERKHASDTQISFKNSGTTISIILQYNFHHVSLSNLSLPLSYFCITFPTQILLKIGAKYIDFQLLTASLKLIQMINLFLGDNKANSGALMGQIINSVLKNLEDPFQGFPPLSFFTVVSFQRRLLQVFCHYKLTEEDLHIYE